jgi:hypothetical protein
MILRKKSQFSHGDFIIGIVIFSLAVILFLKYFYSEKSLDTRQDFLSGEGKLISDSLLTEGYPADWTAEDVLIIGLTNGNSVINEAKLMQFAGMDYYAAKELFKIRCEYYAYFAYRNDSFILINGTAEGKGYPGISLSNLNATGAEDIAKTTRFALYGNEIIKMVILTW